MDSKKTTVLVTGSAGFIGRHVIDALRRRPGIYAIGYDLGATTATLDAGLRSADVIFHLAGVNRPSDPAEFELGNSDFTTAVCEKLAAFGRRPILVLSSSIQAALDNPYGASKRHAEQTIERWGCEEGGKGVVFRLKNVFGKWCRPNYNSVTATFCYNIAHDLPITVADESREIELVYIDDVVAAFIGCLEIDQGAGFELREVPTSYRITLGALAAIIRSFRESRKSLVLPSFSDDFTRRLYATYLSHLPGVDFAYSLQQKSDVRGSLAEFLKAEQYGQIFVSRTKPGVTRGNHYHHTKTEKFLVVEGDAIVRFRHIQGGDLIVHKVSGCDFRVVDIPPGYAHSIENIGGGELVTLFWASEIFDPLQPDTISMAVLS